MKDPAGWANADGSVDSQLEELLRSAQPTRGMTESERLRSFEAVRAIAAVPAPQWPKILAKKVCSGVLVVSTAGALIGGNHGAETQILEEIVPDRSPPPQERHPIPDRFVRGAGPNSSRQTEAKNIEVARVEAPQNLPKMRDPMPMLMPRGLGTPHTERKYSRPIQAKESALSGVEPPVAASRPAMALDSDSERPDDTLARELALIQKAREALGTNASETLVLLDKYQTEFPANRHMFTREVLAIDALLLLGRKAEAHTRAEALLPRVMGTPFEARVQKQLTEAR